jgi:simple sugar transport system permease protein
MPVEGEKEDMSKHLTSVVAGKREKRWVNSGELILRYGTIAMVILLIVIFGALEPRFLGIDNWMNILRSASILIVIAVGMTIGLSAGGFDLSVGTTTSLASMVAAVLLLWCNAPVWISIAVSLLVGMLVGFVNGALVVYLGVNTILATLGMSFVLNGVCHTISKGLPVHNFMTNPWTSERATGFISDSFRWIAIGDIGSIPVLVLIALGISLFGHILLNQSRWGRYFYIIGSNPDAGYMSGINVDRNKVLAYVLCSALAALGGILLTARIGSGQLDVGESYLLLGLLACFVGHTVLAAGKPFVPGTVLGALFATILVNGLTIIGVHPYSANIFRGLALLLAVVIQSYQTIRARAAR